MSQAALSESQKMVLSQARFTDEDRKATNELMASPRFSRQVRELRNAATIPPPPPSALEPAVLSAQPVYKPTPPPRPSWLPAVCSSRTILAEAAFVIQQPSGMRYLKLFYATQSPRMAVFCAFTPQDVVWQSLGATPGDWQQAALRHWEHRNDADFGSFVFDNEIGAEVADIKVLSGL